ncbi:hypothetical protein [endosymbiont of Acanthamoeba sp. UWC8]
MKREKQHRVFTGYAAKGKNSMRWFLAKVTMLLI